MRRGVYAVGRPELTDEARLLAAVLAVGPTALLSHRSAAGLWGLAERQLVPIHVSVPSQSGRGSRAGLAVHRCATLKLTDATRRMLIPITTLPRTLRDFAGCSTRRELRSAVRQSERLHRLDLPGLREAVEAPLAGHREARLRKVLDRYVPGDVGPGMEERFLELCVRARLPIPQTQVWIGDKRVDFLWPAERLVVETDDRASHDTATAYGDDRIADRVLRAAGYDVLRFIWAEVTGQPGAVARELRAALARRRRELGLAPRG